MTGGDWSFLVDVSVCSLVVVGGTGSDVDLPLGVVCRSSCVLSVLALPLLVGLQFNIHSFPRLAAFAATNTRLDWLGGF